MTYGRKIEYSSSQGDKTDKDRLITVDMYPQLLLREAATATEECKKKVMEQTKRLVKHALMRNAKENATFEEQGISKTVIRSQLEPIMIDCFYDFRQKYMN